MASPCGPPTWPTASSGSPVRLRVIETVFAGVAPTHPVGEGEATRIMTGAPMPDGADAVVMVERTSPVGDDAVDIADAVPAGTNVRDDRQRHPTG